MAALGSDITIAIIGQDMASPAFAAAGRGLDDLEHKAGAVGTAFNVAMGVIAAGAAGIAAGIGASISAAATFEKQMSAVGAVAGATGQELQALSALALQLGKDTSFSATEAAQGIEELVKAGVSVKDIMGGGAKGALDLAAAGAVSVKDAAEIASNALNVFNKSGTEMGHVADVIAGAANASAIDVNDFKFSLAASGAVAATVGINFEDLATGIAVMGQAGIKGSDAGTSLKTMFLNLQPSTKAQTAEFQRLGLITAEGANQFFDATGKAKGLADIAGVLQAATKDMTDQQKLATLEVLFGSDAIRAAAVLSKAGAEGFNDMAAAIGKISAADVANARLDNLAGSIEKFKGSAETAAIIIGRAFLPAMKRMVDGNTEALNAFIPTLEIWAEQLPAAIDIAMDTFDALKQNVIEAMRITADVVADWWVRIAPQFDGVREAIAERLGPAFAVITQQIFPAFAATAQIIGSAITTYLLPAVGLLVREIGTTLAAALDWFTTTGGPAMASFITGTLNPALQAWVDWIGPKLQPAITWLFETALPGIVEAGAGFVAWITGTAIPALTAFGEWLQPNLEAAWTWLTSTAFPGIVETGSTVSTWITGTAIPALMTFGEWLQPNLEAAWTWLTETAFPTIVETGATVTTWITGTAIPALTQFGEWLQPRLQAAWEWLTGTAFPAIVTAGGVAVTWITGTAVPALTLFGEWLQPKIEAAWSWFTATALPAIGTAVQTASDAITTVVIPALTEFAAWLQPNLEAAWSWLTSTALPAIGTAMQAAGEIIAATTKFFLDLHAEMQKQEVYTTLRTIWEQLTTIGGQFLNDVLTPMGPTTQTTAQAVGELAAAFKDVASTVSGFLADMQKIADILNAINTAAKDAGFAIRAFLQGLGVPLPDNPIPGIIPSRPGSQSTDPTNPAFKPPGWYDPNNPVYGPPVPPSGPVYGPPVPPGFKPGQTAKPAAGMPPYTTDLEKRAYQYAVAAGHPNPIQFVEQIRQESNFDPGAYNPTSGATGVAQIIPRFHPGVDPNDPDAALKYAAELMTKNYATYGDPNVALAAYNAGPGAVAKYGGVPPYKETQDYLRLIAEREAYARSLTGAPEPGAGPLPHGSMPASGQVTLRHKGTGFESQVPAEFLDPSNPNHPSNLGEFDILGQLPQAPRATGAISVLDPNGIQGLKQTQQEWAGNARDANAICGPRLAALFADAVGRPPTPEEARQLAVKMGVYDPARGFLAAGQFDEYGTALIQQLNPGSTAQLQQTGATGAAAGRLGQEALAAGSPLVGFNTPGHYFGASDFDASTGKFNVGGTGTSYANGKEWMSIAEIEALGGAITNVVTLVDGATGSFATMSQSVQTVGAAAAAGAPQLSEVGAAIDPVVAAFSEGQASAQSLTDAIITQAGASGVGVESSAAYSQGLISQDEALRTVIAGFAETTPAAAELLTQLDAGAISTEQAAVAFAGLATTTAEATGAITGSATAMGEEVPPIVAGMTDAVELDIGTMSDGAILDGDMMRVGLATDATGMATDVTTAVDAMGTDVTTATGVMQTEATTAAEGMASDVTDAADEMQTDVTTAVGDMGTESAEAADTMATDVTEAAGTMQEDTTTAADEMATAVTEAATTMSTDAVTAGEEMATGVVDAATTMAEDGVGAAEEFASGTTDALGEIEEPAQAAAEALEAIGEVEIEAPDVDDVIDAMKDVEKAAKKAADAVKDVGKGGEKSGEGDSDKYGKPKKNVLSFAEGFTSLANAADMAAMSLNAADYAMTNILYGPDPTHGSGPWPGWLVVSPDDPGSGVFYAPITVPPIEGPPGTLPGNGPDDPGTGILYPGTPPGGTGWPEPPAPPDLTWTGPVTPGGIFYPGIDPGDMQPFPGYEPPAPAPAPRPGGGGSGGTSSSDLLAEVRALKVIEQSELARITSLLELDGFQSTQMNTLENRLIEIRELLERIEVGRGLGTNQYNLTVHTQASHEPIEQDFAILAARSRGAT